MCEGNTTHAGTTDCRAAADHYDEMLSGFSVHQGNCRFSKAPVLVLVVNSATLQTTFYPFYFLVHVLHNGAY